MRYNSYHPERGSAVTLVRLRASWFSLFSSLIAFCFCLRTKQKVTKETSIKICAWMLMGRHYSRTVCLKNTRTHTWKRQCEDSYDFISDTPCRTTSFIVFHHRRKVCEPHDILVFSSKHLLCFCSAHSEMSVKRFLFITLHSTCLWLWWYLLWRPSSCPQSLKPS